MTPLSDPSKLRTLIRIFLLVFGCFAIVWGVAAIPLFRTSNLLVQTATQINAGRPFEGRMLEVLEPVVARVEESSFCISSARAAAAAIRLRLYEMKAREAEAFRKKELLLLENSIRKSLACSPANSFLWLALYWIDVVQNGPTPHNLAYLEMSQRLGPNEGWIIAKRVPIIFEQWDFMTSELKESAIEGFGNLVKASLFDEAISILVGPGNRFKHTLTAEILRLPQNLRNGFERAARFRGIDIDLSPPSAPRSESPNFPLR